MPDAAVRTFEVRHLQLARAFLATAAAIMVTFSPDHSAVVGMAVFSGWATATGLVHLMAARAVYPAGSRDAPIALGILTLLSGMLGSLPPLRTDALFFVIVIVWALLTGSIEFVSGLLGRRRANPHARDAITVGAITLLLAVGLLLVNPAYSLEYVIAEAGQSFTLTGITIGVGIFGGYAAILAVYLGIAGFTPRRTVVETAVESTEDAR